MKEKRQLDPSFQREYLGHKRILVVESDEAHQLHLRRTLTTLGYQVTTCTSGLEALERWPDLQMDFEVVLAGQLHSGIPVTEFLQSIRSASEHMPIIQITANRHGGVEGLKHPMRVLARPFTMQQLVDAVQGVLQATPSTHGGSQR